MIRKLLKLLLAPIIQEVTAETIIKILSQAIPVLKDAEAKERELNEKQN